MKKYILAVFSAISLFNLAQAKDFSATITFDKDNIKQMYQEDLKNLSAYISQEVAAQTSLYANERVKNMCKEWPTCEEWAKNNAVKDTTFQVIDAEVSRYVTRFEKEEGIWIYNFYVQTKENGEIKAYLFKRNEKGTSYTAPTLIKKFPGHPIPSESTERIAASQLFKNDLFLWPGLDKWEYRNRVRFGVKTQYIYKYDENGNAVWKRGLYVLVDPCAACRYRVYYFETYQTKAGGDYTYKEPVQINHGFPYPANWNYPYKF